MIDETALNIFTDGSSYSHPRRGGTGIVFVTVNEEGNEVMEEIFSSGYSGASNNQMEIQACVESLKEVVKRGIASDFRKIIIWTDSDYVVKNYKTALYQWSKNAWQKISGGPVLNAEQWKELNKLITKIYNQSRRMVEIRWVKAHSVNEYNNVVDKLAKKKAKVPTTETISIKKVRRKKFKEQKVVVGSVKMLAQRVSIHISEDEFLKVQKVYRYRYQIISRASSFYKYTDFIYSKILLQAGHSYSVKFNSDSKYPQILRVFKEVALRTES